MYQEDCGIPLNEMGGILNAMNTNSNVGTRYDHPTEIRFSIITTRHIIVEQ